MATPSALPIADSRRAVETRVSLRSTDVATGGGDDEPPSPNTVNLLSVCIICLWVALGVYAFQFAPNQTPYRDQIFIKLLTGISQDDSFKVNPVYFSVFNLIGVYTFVYQCLLIPGGRSENRVPAWPFVVASYALGAFALLPYMALWSPRRGMELPPPREELKGWNKLAMKGAETRVLPALVLAASVYLLYGMATATGAQWGGYLSLFDESRLVHISSIDCAILASLCPFWMSNDAEMRDWKERDTLLPVLSFLPVIGPVVYLLLRPKTFDTPEDKK